MSDLRICEQGGIELIDCYTSLPNEVIDSDLVGMLVQTLDRIKAEGINFPFAGYSNYFQLSLDLAVVYGKIFEREFGWTWYFIEGDGCFSGLAIASPHRHVLIPLEKTVYNFLLNENAGKLKLRETYLSIADARNGGVGSIYSQIDSEDQIILEL